MKLYETMFAMKFSKYIALTELNKISLFLIDLGVRSYSLGGFLPNITVCLIEDFPGSCDGLRII